MFKSASTDTTLASLDQEAKSLLQAAQSSNTHTRQQTHRRIGPWFGDPAAIDLAIARLVVAREFGLSSWAQLEHHLANASAITGITGIAGDSDLTAEQLANQFLDLVVIHYSEVTHSGPQRFEQALQLLDKHPSIRTHNIYTAAAIGATEQLEIWLKRQPELINEKGGYFHWSPLMYATYARLPGHSSLDAAHLLLQHNADANAYYLWMGQYKFTALTGAFGEGEGGPAKQPEHPDYKTLCRSLLEHGANANDSQAAYNRCFSEDNSCLELLLEFGLNATDKNNWLLCVDDKLVPNPNETVQFHLIYAIRKGFFERVKLLVNHGADLEKADNTYDTRTKGKKPYEAALIMGQLDIAGYLAANGADTSQASLLSHYQAAVCSANRQQAKTLLTDHPQLASDVKPLQTEMLCNAVETNNQAALQLMIDLDFDLNDNRQRTALHEAALGGHLDLVKLLVKAGADTSLREPGYCVPPIGFAIHAEQQAVIDYLDTQAMDIFTAAMRDNVEQLETLLNVNPENVNVRFKVVRPRRNNTADDVHENDWATPLVFAIFGQKEAAVKLLISKGADLSVTDTDGNSLLTLAEENGCGEKLLELLQNARS